MNDQPANSPGQAPPRNSNSCLKALLIALVIGAVLAVLAIGGCVFMFKKQVKTTPENVAALAGEIAQPNLGDPWQPLFGMDMWFLRVVLYDFEGKGVFALVDGDATKMTDPAEFEAQVRAEIDKQMAKASSGSEATNVLNSTREKFNVRGEEHELLVAESEGNTSKTKYHEVSGTFTPKGAGRVGFVYLRVPSDSFSREQIKAMIEGIR